MSSIRKFAVAETAILSLVGADGALLVGDDQQPMTVTLYGPGSKPFARAKAAQNNQLMDRMTRKGKSEQSADERARERAEFLSACTKDFSVNVAHEDPALTGQALFKAIYSDATIGFIADQAEKFLGDWANFSTPSTTGSAST